MSNSFEQWTWMTKDLNQGGLIEFLKVKKSPTSWTFDTLNYDKNQVFKVVG